MKPSQVIKFFLQMSKYHLSMYQIAKSADLSTNAITRLVDETHKDVSLSMLQKIAKGLARINPYFEPVFWALVGANDITPTPSNPFGWQGESSLFVDPAENPAAIGKVIKHLEKRYPSLAKAIEAERKAFEAQCLPFELEKMISEAMQKERRESPEPCMTKKTKQIPL
jgi:hypothetical protein